MIAAANPLAVEAGLEMLRAGGSALDAAIAVQAVLGLVEPQSSGLGGGAFLLYYDARTGDVVNYDGREAAPRGATADLFLDSAAKPLSFGEAMRSGRSTGVPGVVALLAQAHQDFGRLPWSTSWEPARRLAADGFPVPRRMAAQISVSLPRLTGEARRYLTRDGETPLAEGEQVRNAAYADTVERIAREGAAGFYTGPVAEQIVAAVGREPLPGTLSLADLRDYRAVRADPLCSRYRIWLVCGARPPSSGGVAVLATLGVLEHLPVAESGATSAGWHYVIDSERLAYADRDAYVGDARAMPVPVEALLDREYLGGRAQLIQPDRALQRVVPGTPPGAQPPPGDASDQGGGTSHFVVVDAAGNVVSMTTSVESPFGSQRFVAGFFLNNQLTDFSFRPADESGRPIVNAVAAGKRPRSSMAPTLVFDDGRFLLAVGSPGGNSIIAYVVKSLVATLDWHLPPQEALDLPNVIARGRVGVEPGFDAAVRAELERMGHEFGPATGEGSGLHAIAVAADGSLVGAADRRREGVARRP